MNGLLHDAEKYEEINKRRRRRHNILTFLAAIVVFSTTYALILPAITLARTHTHDESCYTQITTVSKRVPACPVIAEANAGGIQVLHHHDETCFDENGALWCTLPERSAHTHDESCYSFPVHTHTADCYTRERDALICTEEEGEAHTHGDSCYAWTETLSCGKAEGADESAEPVLICGQDELVLHRHSDDCYNGTGALICPLPEVIEHRHTDACFTIAEVYSDPAALTCTNTAPDHIHSALCYGTWVLACDQGMDSDSDDPSDDGGDMIAGSDAISGNGLTATDIELKYYVFLDGQLHLISDEKTLLNVENRRHYITAEALESVYKPYGFSADSFNGELFFPHTDANDPSIIWADASPYQAAAEDGGSEWRIPLSSRNTSYIYYLPNNTPGHTSYFTTSVKQYDSVLMGDNMLYTVNVSAPPSMPSDSGIYYVLNGDSFSVELPVLEDYTWHITNSFYGTELTPDSTEALENGRTLYTFSSVSCAIKIMAVKTTGKLDKCSIRYHANTLSDCLQRLSGEVSPSQQIIEADGSINGLALLTEQVDLTGSGAYQLRIPDSLSLWTRSNAYKQNKGFIYTFRGWRVKATGDILDTSTPLTMQQLYTLENGGVIDLEAVWSALDNRGKVASANFYINLNCEIRDAESNGFAENPMTDYTKSLFTTGMLGTGQLTSLENNYLLLAPPTTESSAYDVDTVIRTMADTPYKGISMTSFPSDQDVFAAIKAGGYTIKINGYEVPAQYLTSDYFQIRWASLKYVASDGWHIDGVLVAKEAKLCVTKTFLGNDTAISQIKLRSGTQEYSIVVENANTAGISSILTLKPAASETRANHVGYTSYDPASDTYTWLIGGAVDTIYRLYEQNYLLSDITAAAFYRIIDRANSTDWQSYDSTSSITTHMVSYAADVPQTSYRTVAFRNYYTDAGTLTLRKIDSFSSDGLSNVEFTITPDDDQLDFSLRHKPGTGMYTNLETSGSEYTENTGSTIVTDQNGDIFLRITAGSYTLVETFPDGYGGASKIRFTVAEDGTLTDLKFYGDSSSAASADGHLSSGVGTTILTVENHSRLLTSVTVSKDWGNTPEDWQKEITVKLMCDGEAIGDASGLYTQTLNAKNHWTYVWKDLPLFINGKVANYTVKETMIGDTAYDSGLDSADGYAHYAVTYDPARYREGSFGTYDDPATWVDANGVTHYSNYVLLTVHNRLDGNSGEIAVTKAFSNLDGDTLVKVDGTYTFGVYDTPEAAGAPLQTTSVVYGNGTVTPDSGIAWFRNLTIGKTYYVFELDDSGNPIRNGSTAIVSDTPFTVSGGGEPIEISADHPSGSVTITNQITYAELPETGSLGSGMIYALGGLQAAGTAMVLKKKHTYKGKRERRR